MSALVEPDYLNAIRRKLINGVGTIGGVVAVPQVDELLYFLAIIAVLCIVAFFYVKIRHRNPWAAEVAKMSTYEKAIQILQTVDEMEMSAHPLPQPILSPPEIEPTALLMLPRPENPLYIYDAPKPGDSLHLDAIHY